MTIVFDTGDQVIPLLKQILHTLSQMEASSVAKHKLVQASQQEALEAISTLHTHLNDAVSRVNNFQQAQFDNITQLKQQVADLADKIAKGDFPDAVVADIKAMQDTADAIDPAPIQPDPVPTPVDPNQPTPAPTPDQPVPAPTPDVPPVDPNQPAPVPPAPPA
jgi:hypothetical protein